MAAKLSKLNWPSLLALVLLAGMFGIARAGNLAVYRGQNTDEGTLVDDCNSGLYSFVMLPYPSTVSNGQALDLTAHRDPGSPGPSAADIQACQSLDVKVLLSLGGGNYSSSADDAQSAASYLWHSFLGGSSPSRPLGDAVLDGINFDTESGNPARYEHLANSLSQFSGHGRKMYLTAAPQRPYPAAVKIASLDSSRASSPRRLHDLKKSSLYVYRPTVNSANKQDPAGLATRLEKGY